MANAVVALRKHHACPMGTCSQCGRERPIVKKGETEVGGQCSTCYSTARKQRMIGDCPGCTRVGVPLASRGLCLRCSKRTAGDFRTAPDARRRDFTAEETHAARERGEDFLVHVLPIVMAFARRRLRRWETWQRDDAIQEIQGLAWVEFIRTLRNGHDPLAYAHCLARRVFESYAGGRRVTGDEPGRDVMSDRVRWAGRAVCQSLSAPAVDDGTAVDQYLHSASRSPIPRRVALRLDYRAWHETLKQKDQVILEFFAQGHPTREASAVFQMRMDSLNKLRASLCSAWERFTAERPAELATR